jgi:methionine sulfoxide reductase heme-binding subunit
LSIAQRYRYIYKPLVFAACVAPFVYDLCGLLPLLGVNLGALDVDLGADPVKRLEHACGKTALNLLLITLAVTPVRELAHLPNLLRLRRMLGLFAFFYTLLHLAVYVVLDLELNFRMVASEIVKRPYITIGMLAILMLVPLAVTSTNRMMRRLGRRWQRLHSLIYPIAILGVWHYYWQVKKDVREPLLYAAILAVLLGYRAVLAWMKQRRRAAPSAPRSGASASAAPEGG